jgi:uncharacterized iron-regulated membrane protein
MREILLFIHRWIGLTAGIIFGIVSLTGGILVYEIEIDELFHGPRFATTPGLVDPTVVLAQVQEQYPDATFAQVDWPTSSANIYRVHFEVDGNRRFLTFDPGSGNEIRARAPNRVLFFNRRVHSSLMIGPIGNRLVQYTSMAAILAIVLGIYLWWPGIRRFWKGFQIRLRRDFYILNFDFHQVLGILSLPLLLALTVTGVLLPHPQMVNRFADRLHGPPPADPLGQVTSTLPADSAMPRASLATITASALRATGGEVSAVLYPRQPQGPFIAVILGAGGGSRRDATRVALDAWSGNVLGTHQVDTPIRFDFDFNERLHLARLGGEVMRLLTAIVCFIGFILLPTGVVVWWIKRSRKATAAERRENRGTLSAQPE